LLPFFADPEMCGIKAQCVPTRERIGRVSFFTHCSPDNALFGNNPRVLKRATELATVVSESKILGRFWGDFLPVET